MNFVANIFDEHAESWHSASNGLTANGLMLLVCFYSSLSHGMIDSAKPVAFMKVFKATCIINIVAVC